MATSRTKPLTKDELPANLVILGQEFSVELGDLSSESSDEHAYGETHGYDRKIIIDKAHPRKTLDRTLFHEAIHAALHVGGAVALLDDKVEEAIVMCMEAAFADIVDIRSLEVGESD